jgi:hypothetical protein
MKPISRETTDKYYEEFTMNDSIMNKTRFWQVINKIRLDGYINEMDSEQIKPICIGRRYNFKKGMEYCEHRERCKFYTMVYDEIINAESIIDFRYKKDFIKCDKYRVKVNKAERREK